jgi:hypothetical protein
LPPEPQAEALRLRAPDVVQVALRRAVAEPKFRRVIGAGRQGVPQGDHHAAGADRRLRVGVLGARGPGQQHGGPDQ